MLPSLPTSPAHCEMDPQHYPPPAVPLPLLDDACYCQGQFCKLPGRIIPPDVQTNEIKLLNGATLTLCGWCTTALNQSDTHPALFGNNTMYQNGFHP